MPKRNDELREALRDSLHTHQSAAVLSASMAPGFKQYPMDDVSREGARALIEQRSDAAITKLLTALGGQRRELGRESTERQS